MTQDELKQFEKLYEKYKFGADNNHTMDLAYYYNEFVNAIPSLLTHITAQATKVEELEELNKNQSSTIADLMVTKDHAAICRDSGLRGSNENSWRCPNCCKKDEARYSRLESENARLRDALEKHRAYIIRISQWGQSKRGSTSVGRLRKSARKFLVGNEAKSGAYCLDCMLPYEFFPVDLIVEDSLWDEITPETEGGQGLLCPMCITKRVANICDGMTLKILAQSAIKGETE